MYTQLATTSPKLIIFEFDNSKFFFLKTFIVLTVVVILYIHTFRLNFLYSLFFTSRCHILLIRTKQVFFDKISENDLQLIFNFIQYIQLSGI